MIVPIEIVSIIVLFCATALAQQPTQVPLWSNGAPGFEDRRDEPERAEDYWVKNIHNPSITSFLAPKGKASGAAVLVCPGGGHGELVFDAEGRDAAKFLNGIGVSAFVLKYRLGREPNSPYDVSKHPREDAMRAMRLIRSRAQESRAHSKRIGMLGFSAGGEVVSMAAFESGVGNATSPDPIERLSAKPNFVLYVYPGPQGLPQSVEKDAPPAFLIVANDDRGAVGNIARLLQMYRDAGASVEAHIFARGGHAFNMGLRSELVSLKHWPGRMADWMADNYILDPAQREAELRKEQELAEQRRQQRETHLKQRAESRLARIAKATETFDPVGTWTWERDSRGSKTKYVLRIEKNGGEFVGTCAITGGRRGNTEPIPISDVSFEGNELTFKVVRSFNDRKFSTLHEGTVTRDSITGFSEVSFGRRPREERWVAKRTDSSK